MRSESSCHIVPLWMYLFSQVLQGEEMALVNGEGKMCMKCFSAYDRFTKQLQTLKKSLSNITVATTTLRFDFYVNRSQTLLHNYVSTAVIHINRSELRDQMHPQVV